MPCRRCLKRAGFPPLSVTRRFRSNLTAPTTLGCIMEAIRKAGYEPGKDMMIAMDYAASEFCVKENNVYYYDYSQLKMAKEGSEWEETDQRRAGQVLGETREEVSDRFHRGRSERR